MGDLQSIPLRASPEPRAGTAALRRVLPPGLIRAQRHIRSQRVPTLASESWALSRVPRIPAQSVRASRRLEVADVLGSSDPGLWGRVSKHIEQAGLGHNDGGVNPGDRRAISAIVAHLRPETVLEVGTHVGSSTLTLAATLDHIGSRIKTVDIADVNDTLTRPWARYGAPHSPAEIVRNLAPVEFFVDSSLSYLADTDERYEFIFLDGDHSAATVYQELPLALSRLRPGGVILMHDYFPQGRRLWEEGELILGPFLAVRRLLKEGWPISVVPLGELPWPTKLGRNVTSLALVLGR